MCVFLFIFLNLFLKLRQSSACTNLFTINIWSEAGSVQVKARELHHTHMHTDMDTHAHIRVHTHTHSLMRTHRHTHTQRCRYNHSAGDTDLCRRCVCVYHPSNQEKQKCQKWRGLTILQGAKRSSVTGWGNGTSPTERYSQRVNSGGGWRAAQRAAYSACTQESNNLKVSPQQMKIWTDGVGWGAFLHEGTGCVIEEGEWKGDGRHSCSESRRIFRQALQEKGQGLYHEAGLAS